MKRSGSLLQRLVVYVSVGMTLFAVLMGAVIYIMTITQELENAASLEQQLVYTVQAQAEVAVFASNAQIAQDLIEGLRANPRIRAVRIKGSGQHALNIASGFSGPQDSAETKVYPLFSPVDGKERIGELIVASNESMIQAQATVNAFRQVLVMLAQLLITVLLILVVFRWQISQPIAKLAADVAAISPGAGERVTVDDAHARDEIGSLASSTNALIASAEKAMEAINALATTDALTGLPNRRAFMERIQHELSRFQRHEVLPACVLMLDLDHFKDVNDHHGHPTGDAVLAQLGTLLTGELRKIDSVGRLGGEEFAVVLPNTDLPAAMVFAERLRQRIADQIITHESLSLHISSSIGVAEMRVNDLRPEDVMSRADKALYVAKQRGRNQVVAESSV